MACQYLIGADGPRSGTRSLKGSELETDPFAMYSQDVIFDADLSALVGDEKGSLLYTMTPEGVSIFQPLDGKRRWRIQLFKPEEADLSEEQIIRRIRLAVGDESVPIELTSVGNWQPTPGCATKMQSGRIFLAGDAAHVTVPTGGMGNNIGFLGARNLAWKLAYVLKGYVGPEILATYEEELRPAAEKRIQHGINISRAMAPLIGAIFAGEDTAAGVESTSIYADYDNVILGHEATSPLIASEPGGDYTPADPIRDFEPLVRNGRRAPHVWVDERETESILDSFSTGYTLIAGAEVDCTRWLQARDQLDTRIPLEVVQLSMINIYAADGLVLVRPDGVIADHWIEDSVTDEDLADRMSRMLPDTASFS